MKNGLFALLTLWFAGCATPEAPAGLLGSYRLDDGRVVSIRPSADDTLRYRLFEDGSSGRLYHNADNEYVSGPGFAQREPVELVVHFFVNEAGTANALEWTNKDDATLSARRIGTEGDVWFTSGGTQLFGRLHLPEGPPPYPVVVLVHGSGDSAATKWFYNGDFFAANGFAAFTFDKRGSGRSEGSFTFDFELLAADVTAAVEYLSDIAEIDNERIGLAAYSQGAWVGPLAASKNDKIKFVVVNYGIIESPFEEARLEMRQLLVDGGVTESDLESADELIRASIDVVASRFSDGWARFEELKIKYADATWLKYLDDTPVGQLVAWPKFLVKLIGPRRLPKGLRWHYDSVELLQKSDVPMVWLLGGRDISAPNEQTIPRLRSLIEAGKPYELTLFPDADHGMLLFDEQNGQRAYTGYSPGYFRAEVDAIRKLATPVK